MSELGVIGTGTWGTAMAIHLARRGNRVLLWGRRPDFVDELREVRRHPGLEGTELPPALECTADPAGLADTRMCLWAVPTQHSRAQATALAGHLPGGVPVVSLSKGLEHRTLLRVTEILAEELAERPLGVLAGPSHAEEVAGGKPCGLVAAGSGDLPDEVVACCHDERVRVYTSSDLLGVELGGALKNVVAIAAGICDGHELGDNIKATLVTRGLAEIRRLGRAMGADDATFAGLAGIGDLLTTCYSPYGRNRALGVAVGRGASFKEFQRSTTMVAEGAWTCRAAVTLAERYGTDLPIAREVQAVLWDDKPVDAAMRDLLARAAKEEDA